MIRIGILDRQPLVHGGVRYLLSTFPDLEISAEAYEEDELFYKAPRLDVALVEVADLKHSIGARLRQLRRVAPTLRTIVFTGKADVLLIRDALAAGAHGYLLKSSSALTVASAIRDVAAGRQVLAPEATEALRGVREPATTGAERLTLRERDVLTLLTRGYSNQEIAERLCITVHTVKFHMTAIYSKLEVSGRTQVIIRAFDLNLVSR
jgi:DNA-binding NarL/FixJ family response regulator